MNSGRHLGALFTVPKGLSLSKCFTSQVGDPQNPCDGHPLFEEIRVVHQQDLQGVALRLGVSSPWFPVKIFPETNSLTSIFGSIKSQLMMGSSLFFPKSIPIPFGKLR